MAKAVPTTRIIVEAGYNKWILPEGTSADQISVLVNAIPVESSYLNGKNVTHLSRSQHMKVEMHVISVNDVKNFIDDRNDEHGEYDIIISEVRERLQDKVHAFVLFKKDKIFVGPEDVNYVDLANPDVDPETVIEDIVQKALLNKPNREI